MKNTLVIVITLLLMTEYAASQQAPPEASADVAFINVNVVPMDRERILEGHTVLVEDDRITWLGPSNSIELPGSLQQIDGTGKYLMPGLVDSHVHLEGGDDLVLYVANGVTSVRNLWGQPHHLKLRQRIADDSRLVSPTIYTAGPIIDGQPPIWPGSSLAMTAEEGRREVNKQANAGYDFIKVYDRVSAEAYEAILETAVENNLTVQGHIPKAIGLFQALSSGHYAIDHFKGYREEIFNADVLSGVPSNQIARRFLDEDFDWDEAFPPDAVERAVKATIAAGAWNIPTVVIHQPVAPDEYETRLGDPGTQYFSKAELDGWKPKARIDSDGTRAERKFLHELSHRLIAGLHRAGGNLLVGTDASDPFVLPGFSMHDELEHFVQSGLSPYETLERATRISAEFMGVADQVGTIAPQQRADFLLLHGNPLTDLSHLRQLAGVSLRGHWLSSNEITDLLKKIETEAMTSTNEPVEIQVEQSTLESYVGVYELGPNRLFKVTLEGTTLFAQMSGRVKTPIFPKSKTTFFAKPAEDEQPAGRPSLPNDALLSFTTDDSGAVTGIVLQQRGMELPGSKRTARQ